MPAESSPTSIPTLETERLRLRAHTLEDVPSSVAMWSDPRVTRFIGGIPATEQQTWARILAYLGHWTLMGFGYWALEERATGRFAGELGFAEFRREITPSIRAWPEIGWALAPSMQRRGYAREAIAAVLAWGDANLASERTVCIISPENTRSLRLAEHFGYRRLERTRYLDEPVHLMSRDRPQGFNSTRIDSTSSSASSA